MIVGIVTFTLRLSFSHSLKDKRSEVQKLLAALRNRFLLSVYESGKQDLRGFAEISAAVLCANTKLADQVLQSAIEYVERNTAGEVMDVRREYR